MKNCLSILSLASLGLAFITILIFFYWLFYPYKVMEAKSPAKVLTPIVHAGDRLVFINEACKYMPLVATTTRQIIDNVVINLPEIKGNMPVGCHKMENKNIIIPDFMDTGEAKVLITNTYQVNPFRTVSYTYETEVFKIVK